MASTRAPGGFMHPDLPTLKKLSFLGARRFLPLTTFSRLEVQGKESEFFKKLNFSPPLAFAKAPIPLLSSFPVASGLVPPRRGAISYAMKPCSCNNVSFMELFHRPPPPKASFRRMLWNVGGFYRGNKYDILEKKRPSLCIRMPPRRTKKITNRCATSYWSQAKPSYKIDKGGASSSLC